MRAALVLVVAALAAAAASARPLAATLSVFSAGPGTVTSDPSGISCPRTCAASFASGQLVTLTPVPSAGARFTGWGGECAGTGACTVAMSADRAVTATFTAGSSGQPQLTVTVLGSGTVTSSPAGISCPDTCDASFASGTTVRLTALPQHGTSFSGWGGACSGTTCTVTMTADRAVSASFGTGAAPGAMTLTVTVQGRGTVTSNPAGISCPDACSATFPAGTAVQLTALVQAGTSFSGWGGACSGTTTCTVTMTADRAVTASFGTGAAPGDLTLTVTVQGRGIVTSAPAGISCPNTCSATFPESTVVQLRPLPSATTSFSGWSGVCTGTGLCSVVVTEASSVTATFGSGVEILGAPPARLVLGGRTWRGVAGNELRGFIATFAASAADYVATIEWGDGRRSGGQVAPIFTGSWSVFATHAYGRAGRYTIRVRVTRLGAQVVTIRSTAEVRRRTKPGAASS